MSIRERKLALTAALFDRIEAQEDKANERLKDWMQEAKKWMLPNGDDTP